MGIFDAASAAHGLDHCVLAPALIHAPSCARSASVMPVSLPSGIVRVATAIAQIRGA